MHPIKILICNEYPCAIVFNVPYLILSLPLFCTRVSIDMRIICPCTTKSSLVTILFKWISHPLTSVLPLVYTYTSCLLCENLPRLISVSISISLFFIIRCVELHHVRMHISRFKIMVANFSLSLSLSLSCWTDFPFANIML